MAALTVMRKPSSAPYPSAAYSSSHRSNISRQEEEKFSLIIRLPDDTLLRIKNIRDGSSVQYVKKKLELISGFTPSTYSLYDVDGGPIDETVRLRLGDSISDNDILKLSPIYPYGDIYDMLSKEHGAGTQDLDLPEELFDKDMVFNIMFMASFCGDTEYCRTLLFNQDIMVNDTTPNGNTYLHAATAKDRVSTALLLCEHGADIYQKNARGDTPLDVALECGSFTCERKLRLSQWTRRRAKLTRETEYTRTFTVPARDVHISTMPTQQYAPATQPATYELDQQMMDNDSSDVPSTHIDTEPKPTTTPIKYTASKGASRPSTAVQLHQRPATEGRSRSRMSTVNHDMPAVAVEKKRERLQRAKSAPLLNSELKNKRLCKEMARKQIKPDKKPEEKKQRQHFTVTRPQFLQYIKSSTGVVEVDFFADIFPDQDEKPKDTRPFDDQMKRNERIFKRMFKESGVAHRCSDTDSEEELERAYANNKAVKRWNRKKKLQKQEERKASAIAPVHPTSKVKKETLGELLLIGDTSSGPVPLHNPDTYIRAYQTYREESQGPNITSSKQEPQSKTTSSKQEPQSKTSNRKSSTIDPITYEEWATTKTSSSIAKTKTTPCNENKIKLIKRIDYKTWLEAANKRINKQITLQRKEVQQKKDFEEWIQELKDEVGTFDYWKHRKEEQLAKERQNRLKKQQEQRQESEKGKRRELSRDIYKHWAISKDMSKLQQEEKKLEKEKERLRKAKQPPH